MDRESFINWLLVRDAKGMSVGVGRDSHECPLACYIRSTDPDIALVTIATRSYTTSDRHNKRRNHELPLWAQNFVRRIDSKPYTNQSGTISADVALKTLLEG